MANRIKKGDQVVVNAGKDKGKQGEVVRVDGDRVVVANVNIVKRHTAEPAGRCCRRRGRARSFDPYLQRERAEPGFGQGRTRWLQGAGGWTQTACVPLQR